MVDRPGRFLQILLCGVRRGSHESRRNAVGEPLLAGELQSSHPRSRGINFLQQLLFGTLLPAGGEGGAQEKSEMPAHFARCGVHGACRKGGGKPPHSEVLVQTCCGANLQLQLVHLAVVAFVVVAEGVQHAMDDQIAHLGAE